MIRLVQELAADGFPVPETCWVLEVPTSAYCEDVSREPSAREVEDRHLTGLITEVHKASRGTYAAPWVHAELRLGLGVRVGRKRVALLMRGAEIQWVSHRRKKRHQPDTATHDDLVQRQLTAAAPDRVWSTDSVAPLLPRPAPRGEQVGLLLRGSGRVQPQGRGLVDR